MLVSSVEKIGQTIRIKKIVLPFDFSDCSRQALNYAVSFARVFEAKIFLLHVVALSPYVPEISISLEGDQLGLKKKLSEMVNREVSLIKEMGIESEGYCVIGEPTLEIVNFAEEQFADLIMMGTHGRTGFTHILLGSTTERVIERAPCPVLTLKVKREAPLKSEMQTTSLSGNEKSHIPPAENRNSGSCRVCSEPAQDIICDKCKVRIQAEAFEQKSKVERAGKVETARK
ncbi:MAG: universal stress protein [Nitrospirae bacterium]|nr:universal stress protein [Nitrospirota bacterium]